MLIFSPGSFDQNWEYVCVNWKGALFSCSSVLIFLVSYYFGFKVLSAASLKYQTCFSPLVNFLVSPKKKEKEKKKERKRKKREKEKKKLSKYIFVFITTHMPAISPSDLFGFFWPLSFPGEFHADMEQERSRHDPGYGCNRQTFSLRIFCSVGVGHFCINF